MKYIINTSLEGSITSERLDEIKTQLSVSIQNGESIQVCCEGVDKVDLAGFNALVTVYMAATRAHKSLRYINCSQPKLVDLISQTQFNHVFVVR